MAGDTSATIVGVEMSALMRNLEEIENTAKQSVGAEPSTHQSHRV